MVASERYHNMVALLDEHKALPDKTEALKLIASYYGLTHVAYLGVALPSNTSDQPLVCVTYPDEWVDHYREERYVRIDPVIHRSLTSILPTDWSEFPLHGKRIQQLFGEAREFGIGTRGLTFPIRGRLGETALFSISSNMLPADWKHFKEENLPEMQMLAFYVHRLISLPLDLDEPPHLGPREIECLRWSAAGKTADDVATILNLSPKTVRAYLESARHKLNGLNITHAVARAGS
jgi:DNA-binding CsgD family transcriptional regulator